MNERLKQLHRIVDIVECYGRIEKKKLINIICLEFGVTAKKSKEYINLLLAGEEIIERDELIIANDVDELEAHSVVLGNPNKGGF